jgi:hypothetical protein
MDSRPVAAAGMMPNWIPHGLGTVGTAGTAASRGQVHTSRTRGILPAPWCIQGDHTGSVVSMRVKQSSRPLKRKLLVNVMPGTQ